MRLPPALNVALLTTLSLLAGCLEPVESGGDPDLDAAAQEAADAIEALTDESGHIAGTVSGDDGAALAGARVELDGLDAVDTDGEGRFAFVDVTPGEHLLAVRKDGYVEAVGIVVPVAAQEIARPSVMLAEVPPAAYHETLSFVFYSQASFMGPVIGCSCDQDVVLAEGATEAVLEVVSEQTLLHLGQYAFQASTYDADEAGNVTASGYADGWLDDRAPARLPSNVLAGMDGAWLRVAPDTLDAFTMYTVYLTVFYHGPAPEGFSAVE